MKNKIRVILTCIILFSVQLAYSQESVNFIVFGDWGSKGAPIQKNVANQMSVWAQNYNAKFIISTGDNFYENGVKSTSDYQWHATFEDVYTASSLQVPWYVVLGNHDYHGNVQAEIDYSNISSRWKMPSRYYTFSYQVNDSVSALFVVIDTSPIVISDEEYKQYTENVLKFNNNLQLNWLDSVLTNSTAKWKFVIGHHPVLSGGYHGGQKEMQQLIKPILEKDNADIYFCGHDHDMQHLIDKKFPHVNYFVSGAGSEPRTCENTSYTLFHQGNIGGFLGAAIFQNEMKLVFIDENGEEIYNTVIKR